MGVIDEVKSRLDIVDLVSETVKLRRTGKNYTGFCPFHANSRTPAFVVFPDSGTWRCFGQCNEGGDVFRFVMKKEGWDFPQALRFLAQKAGVELEPFTPEKKAEDEHLERLHALLEEVVHFYRHQLLKSPAGQPALAYLYKRGLKDETIEVFGLGYALDSWEAATHHFRSKGYSAQELVQAGIASERSERNERQDREGVYDRFRNRIMFPIRTAMGQMAGFGARILNPDDVPKFLNSPQTQLFDKGRLLYGLDQARKAIRSQDQVVIVEGYLDVILLHQAGYTNTVSPMGTALTEDQLHLLKRFTRRIVLALDADAAGQKATLRGLEMARQAMDHSDEIVFDAFGLLHHEARLEADLRVTTLPMGMDPDEVVLRDPAEWGRILAAAQPVVIHVMETLALGRNLDDPKVKSEIVSQVLPLIEDVPNAVEREAYRQRLARLVRVDERSLMGAKSAPARPRRRPGLKPTSPVKPMSSALVASAAQLVHDLEGHCLRLLLRQPDALYLLDRSLQKAQLSRFDGLDFEQADCQILAHLVLRSLEQDQLEPDQFIHEQMPESLQELARRLLEPLPQGEPSSNALIEDLVRSVIRLRLVRINESLNQLRYMQEELQQQGELRLEAYQEMVVQYATLRDRLDRALRQPVDLT